MYNINIEKEVQSIIKEGFLDKESRFWKTWRRYILINSADGLCSHRRPSLLLKTARCILRPLR